MNFTEEQRFSRMWWVLIPILSSLIIILSVWYAEKDLSAKTDILSALVTVVIVETFIAALFFSMKLTTNIDQESVSYKFSPFMGKKQVRWADIEKAEVRKYSPLREYGGWGMRKGFTGKNRAYNVWGNKGLQLVLKSGKKILLGTQKHTEMVAFLRRLKEKYGIEPIQENFNG